MVKKMPNALLHIQEEPSHFASDKTINELFKNIKNVTSQMNRT